jgi:hypothetical protein
VLQLSNQRHIADRACTNVCTLQPTEGQASARCSLSYLPLTASSRCLSVISTFASICSLPLSHTYLYQHLRAASLSYLPLPASARCLCHIYLCQHLLATSLSYLPLPAPLHCLSVISTFASTFALPLCHIYLYSILIVKSQDCN